MSDKSRLKTIKTITQIKSNQKCDNKRQALSQIKRIDWKSLEFRTKNQKTFYFYTNFFFLKKINYYT